VIADGQLGDIGAEGLDHARALGLQNTLTGLIVAYCSFTLPFTVWIMKAYFETVPADLDKSALVDGCNRFQAYYKVVLPVSGPGLVASGAFTFMLCWTSSWWPRC